MRYHNSHVHSLIRRDGDSALVIGVAGGRVNYEPEARWLYSLRIMLLIVRIELLWTTA